jgi:YidC/Oxa1 family membrane protein insertase
MSATMDKSQRYLMMALPIFFIPFLLRFPMGLVIYWVTTNLWTVGQGLVTRRLAQKPGSAPAGPKRSSRTPPQQTDGTAAPAPAAVPEPRTAPQQSSQPRRVKRKKRARR